MLDEPFIWPRGQVLDRLAIHACGFAPGISLEIPVCHHNVFFR